MKYLNLSVRHYTPEVYITDKVLIIQWLDENIVEEKQCLTKFTICHIYDHVREKSIGIWETLN